MEIILASLSPRRREILGQLGINFKIITADVNEQSDIKEPELLVKELSYRKAAAALKDNTFGADTLIIGCDTVVSKNGFVLGKPKDKSQAYDMLKGLSGGEHTVVSGLTLIYNGTVLSESESTSVFFDDITDDEINRYLDTDEPYDKAGAYAIQGFAARWIKGINGCYYNVVGLPVNLLRRLAIKLNINLF